MSRNTEPGLSKRSVRIGGAILIVIGAAVVVTGIASRRLADAHLNEWTEAQAAPYVKVARPETGAQREFLELPGRLEAYAQAQIYSRVSGYLRDWRVDIGAHVRTGQVLAEIDAPDLDQQIAQAQAQLTSAQANAELARTTLERGQSLIRSGAVSQQTLDQRKAEYSSLQGVVRSSVANLDRLRVLEKYKQITAPFDGVVIARGTDVGVLVNAGSGGAAPLFVVADTSRLRVYVNVPQRYVPSIKIGTKADLAVPEYPGRGFTATVEASSQAVDAASGTTRMQLVVDNAEGRLLTGGYASVKLRLPEPEVAISIPSSALIFDRNGLRVAVVGDDQRVALKPVTIARDFGQKIEIASGLAVTDRVIVSPPDGIAVGDRVRIVEGGPAPAQPGAATKPPAEGAAHKVGG
jgi:RND family efflux transporter MFP subunit